MNEQEKKEFEAHLQNCQECRDCLKAFDTIKNSAQLTSAPLQTINAIFENTTRKKSFFSFAEIAKSWKITVAFAAGLIVGICAFSLKDFTQQNGGIRYYSDISIEEIESIDYYLDEMEDYFMV
jgi:predicted anti-sigma-YlaC factor YlaD